MLCSYGCGNKAIKQFKNGKYCCSTNISGCSIFKKIKSKKLTGRIRTEEHCRNISISRKGIPPWCKGKKGIFSDEVRKRISDSKKGKKLTEEHKQKISSGVRGKGMFGKKHTTETIEKIRKSSMIQFSSEEFRKRYSEKMKGRKLSEEIKLKISKSNKGKIPWNKGLKGVIKISDEERENRRKRMLNGGAIRAIKGIQNPSKEEVKLRNIVKDIYPKCKYQYKVLNYALDIAIPKYKVAIEYDGWYHFDTEEHILYHRNREDKIKKRGWKIIKFNIFRSFPSKDEVMQCLLEQGEKI